MPEMRAAKDKFFRGDDCPPPQQCLRPQRHAGRRRTLIGRWLAPAAKAAHQPTARQAQFTSQPIAGRNRQIHATLGPVCSVIIVGNWLASGAHSQTAVRLQSYTADLIR